MPALTLSTNINGTLPNIAFNDLYLTQQGNISTSFDLEAVLQECAQAARTLLGECIFNTTIGIPYEQVLWVGVPNIQQYIASLRSAFLAVAGVTEVISIVAEQQTNTVTVSQSADVLVFTAIIQTIYGTGVVQ